MSLTDAYYLELKNLWTALTAAQVLKELLTMANAKNQGGKAVQWYVGGYRVYNEKREAENEAQARTILENLRLSGFTNCRFRVDDGLIAIENPQIKSVAVK